MFNFNKKIKNKILNPICIAEISRNHNGSIELANSKIALLPKFYPLLLGKKSKRNNSFGEPITIKDLEK